MDKGHLTERADKFAKKFIKKEPEDLRSPDERIADFADKWTPERIKRARRNAKRAADA